MVRFADGVLLHQRILRRSEPSPCKRSRDLGQIYNVSGVDALHFNLYSHVCAQIGLMKHSIL